MHGGHVLHVQSLSDTIRGSDTWTIALSGRHTFTRARVARIAPAGLPDLDHPLMVLSNPIKQRCASSYSRGKLLEALKSICF